MTGKTSARRQPLPDSASAVAMEKRNLGMVRAVVPVVGSTTEIVAKNSAGKYARNAGKKIIVVRRMGRGGPAMTHPKAVALKACGGKRDGAFKSCVATALGRAPKAFIEHSGANVSRRKIV